MFWGRKPKSDEPFEALVESHLDSLYATALRFTRNPVDAEDLVQDTVLRALRFRDRFELGTNFRAWILTVLTNTYFHRYRRKRKEADVLSGATVADVERQLTSDSARDATQHPEAHFFRQLLSDDVIRALDRLPDEYRTVVVLCDVEGLSYREIAEAVDCPVGTVMSRLYRARRQLELHLVASARESGVIRADGAGSGVVNLKQYQRRKRG